jgi:hypothetical protein
MTQGLEIEAKVEVENSITGNTEQETLKSKLFALPSNQHRRGATDTQLVKTHDRASQLRTSKAFFGF